ncbi:MAG: hypothetical protein R3F58_08455 [Steroidobacteraceae bacterium]
MLDPYFLLVTLHVVLFAYWLGGDFGVFVTSRYIARPDLPVAERERFLQALLAIDILPRTAIVLLPVVGLHLAVLRGALDLPPWAPTAIWLLGALWLAVVWMAYLTVRSPNGIVWQRIDISWRVILITVLIVTGVVSLTQGAPVTSHWVATKLCVYAALLIVGLYLRTSIRGWRIGFGRLKAGESGPQIDALFVDGRRRAKYAAFVFWSLIILMAWLGIAQPF